jgi:hypothetical protein
MSKYVKQGEIPVRYECTKRKCKWQGTYEEKAEKKIEEGYYEKICPNCGNSEFYGLSNPTQKLT